MVKRKCGPGAGKMREVGIIPNMLSRRPKLIRCRRPLVDNCDNRQVNRVGEVNSLTHVHEMTVNDLRV